MSSHSEGPGIWLSVWRFLLTQCLYERAAEVLTRLRGCAGPPWTFPARIGHKYQIRLTRPKCWRHSNFCFSPTFYVTFWSLGVYDINVPTTSYEKQVTQLQNQISSIEDSENMVGCIWVRQEVISCQTVQHHRDRKSEKSFSLMQMYWLSVKQKHYLNCSRKYLQEKQTKMVVWLYSNWKVPQDDKLASRDQYKPRSDNTVCWSFYKKQWNTSEMTCPFELRQIQQNECVSIEDSDQPGHPPSLIRVFTVHMKKPCVLSYPLSAQQRLWSDWVDAKMSVRPAKTQISLGICPI